MIFLMVTGTLAVCTACRRIYRSQELARLVPAGCNFGYDILVHVGQALFLRHRRSQEISDELAAQNVRISPSEVEYLARKFIVYLAIAHRQAAPAIQQAMRAKGGYILHLDATCDHKEPFLMSSLDSISQIVLGNVKLPSEKAEMIIPFLEEIKRLFGEPIASVHDMGAGILNAVAKVFPGRPDYICHYHFLCDIGKDLLGRDYDTLRKRLHKHGIAGQLRRQARKLKPIIDDQGRHSTSADQQHHGTVLSRFENGIPPEKRTQRHVQDTPGHAGRHAPGEEPPKRVVCEDPARREAHLGSTVRRNRYRISAKAVERFAEVSGKDLCGNESADVQGDHAAPLGLEHLERLGATVCLFQPEMHRRRLNKQKRGGPSADQTAQFIGQAADQRERAVFLYPARGRRKDSPPPARSP